MNKTGDRSAEQPTRIIKRYEVGLCEAGTESSPVRPVGGGLVVISADDDGVSGCVAERLHALGYKIAFVTLPGRVPEGFQDSYHILGTGEAAVEGIFKRIAAEEQAPLTGFIHIASRKTDLLGNTGLPVGDFPESETNALKTIFLCAKNFVRYVRPDKGPGFFVSAARMDGRFGQVQDINTVQGGLFGLHKSLVFEWEDQILSKAVDLAAELPPEKAADYLIEEVFRAGYEKAEVGRSADGNRNISVLTEKYPETGLYDKGPEASDVLLITGGGRGVTASCAISLARQSGCGFILVGRTDLAEDISWAEGAEDKAGLRWRAIAKLKEADPKLIPKPSKVNRLVELATNHAEITDTLKTIAAAGGRVKYISCDVRDRERLKAELAQCEQEMGPITGLVHGAGNIADKRIQRKTAGDFENVFGSKIGGLEACLGCIDPERLKYLILFSSVSGYFGNSGQTDYAMANEVMNKFAFRFHRTYPVCKTMSVNWGLWDGGSMASDTIRKAIKGTEVRLIPLEIGTRYFIEQFLSTQESGVCQIVVNWSDRMFRPLRTNDNKQEFRV